MDNVVLKRYKRKGQQEVAAPVAPLAPKIKLQYGRQAARRALPYSS